jgi:hypothetical protein
MHSEDIKRARRKARQKERRIKDATNKGIHKADEHAGRAERDAEVADGLARTARDEAAFARGRADNAHDRVGTVEGRLARSRVDPAIKPTPPDPTNTHDYRIGIHDNRLGGHDNDLAAHDTRITNNGNELDAHDVRITNNGNELNAHDVRITDHGTRLNSVESTLPNKFSKSGDSLDGNTNYQASNQGPVLKSPNGTTYRIHVNNDGSLGTVST